MSTFTVEELEATWRRISEFERDNLGQRFGPDFVEVATLLRQSKQFMMSGAVSVLMAGLQMGELARRTLRGADETKRKRLAGELMEKPNAFHQTLAELFYLGFEMGRHSREVETLEKMAKP
jgi:hypothetical protein